MPIFRFLSSIDYEVKTLYLENDSLLKNEIILSYEVMSAIVISRRGAAHLYHGHCTWFAKPWNHQIAAQRHFSCVLPPIQD